MFSFTSAANPSCVAVEKSSRDLRTSELLPSTSLFKFESPLCSLHFQAGLQITDYVHHSNETSKRESIISVGEAVPLHPTHTQWKKVGLVGVLLCLIKSVRSCRFAQHLFLIQQGGEMKASH